MIQHLKGMTGIKGNYVIHVNPLNTGTSLIRTVSVVPSVSVLKGLTIY